MKSVLELLYNDPIGNWGGGIHGPDSIFVKTARIKCENYDMLMGSLTDTQKVWLEGYSEANSNLEEMMSFDKFSYAFHLGAQMMFEMVHGKEALLK